MNLELIDNMPFDVWDQEISSYKTKVFFHQSAWLQYLEETQAAKIVRFRIMNNGNLEGYFAGLLVKKGFWNILGSPLPGWGTDYMGPIVNDGFDQRGFLESLERKCREIKIHHVEMCHPCLSPEEMQKAGFSVSEGMTYLVPLSTNEEEMWQRLDGKRRNTTKKAIKNGLVVEETDDPGFVDEYYRELIEVFAKQQLVPTYNGERGRTLVRHLKPNHVFTLQVKAEDEIVATGIFPYDDRCLYFWGGASWLKHQHLCPNDLLHWDVMVRAARLGITQYDLCGSGSFKAKMGGEQVAVYRYHKSYSLSAKWARDLYKTIFYARQKLLGRLKNKSEPKEAN